MRGPSTPLRMSPGMPMSAMTMSPARVSAGGRTSGSFGAASVTVSPASIDGPIGSAESADRPDGRSIATTGIPEALTSAITDSMSPDTGAFRPVPKMASTMSVQSLTSEKCSSHAWLSAISTTVRPSRPRISRLARASPRTSATRPMRNTDTSTPRCTSVRATTKPSPPLLPRPQRTATWRSERSLYIVSMAATACRPAFSMRTSDEMPMSSIVRRSASRICAEFSTRIYVKDTKETEDTKGISQAGCASDLSVRPLCPHLRVRPWCPTSASDLCVRPLCPLLPLCPSSHCVLLLTVSLVSCVPLRYSPPMGATVNVNGRVFDQEHAVISVFDHGFLYGEGVYETLRTYNGQPFLFDRHMRRLRNSSGMIALAVPLTDEQLDARCRETIRAAGLGK